MKLVTFEQGSEEWLIWRSCGIGASDAAAILGVSPWQTREQLLAHKVRHRHCRDRVSDKNKTESMLRGTRMEPEARQAYIDLTGIEVTPACVIHETYPWMRASLDGLSRDEKTAVEIKCVNKDDHRSAVEGLVPTKYWPQVQHQLLVTGLPRLHYWSFSTSTTFISENRKALVVVKADADYMSYLLEGEQKFWDDFLERTKK